MVWRERSTWAGAAFATRNLPLPLLGVRVLTETCSIRRHVVPSLAKLATLVPSLATQSCVCSCLCPKKSCHSFCCFCRQRECRLGVTCSSSPPSSGILIFLSSIWGTWLRLRLRWRQETCSLLLFAVLLTTILFVSCLKQISPSRRLNFRSLTAIHPPLRSAFSTRRIL
jgi:hypothetical protein